MAISVEDIGQLLSQEPPRQVQGTIYRSAYSGMSGLGGLLFGLFFACFGLVMAYFFFPWSFHEDLRLDFMETELVRGSDIQSRTTRMTTGGGKNQPGNPVYEVTYRFQVDGKNYHGSCYTTNIRHSNKVQYLVANPSVHRLKGTTKDWTGYGGAFVMLFPLFGLIFSGVILRSRWRIRGLLRNGCFASGAVVDVLSTNTRVNNQVCHRIQVTFFDGASEREAEYRGYGSAVDLAKQKRDAGEEVGVLYDPDDPKKIMLLDSLLDS